MYYQLLVERMGRLNDVTYTHTVPEEVSGVVEAQAKFVCEQGDEFIVTFLDGNHADIAVMVAKFWLGDLDHALDTLF
jgi:hypothetical protein